VLDFFPILKTTSPGERTLYTLFSGPAEQAPIESDGEIYLWREDFDFFDGATPSPRHTDAVGTVKEDEGTDDHMTLVAGCLGLGRGPQLVTESAYEALGNDRRDDRHCRVPTPEKKLSGILKDVPFGCQQTPNAQPVWECNGTASYIHPVLESTPRSNTVPRFTSTLAQKFIKHPPAKWFNDHQPQLRLEVPICRQMLIWARMMLVSGEDEDILQKTDVFRGVLASLYHFQADPSLVAAFLTYWKPVKGRWDIRCIQFLMRWDSYFRPPLRGIHPSSC
jgi:hypothetical protein